MNQPTLNPGLAQLLEKSGVRTLHSDVIHFSAYIPGEPNVAGSGIDRLVRFRLGQPGTVVLFFSFLPIEHLRINDAFGVLKLARTEFIQLPCSKESILQAATKQSGEPTTLNVPAWQNFSESACTTLIKRRMRELMHGNKFPIGNKVLNPLRLNCSGLLSMPQLKEDYLPLLQRNFEALHQFTLIPEIAELLHWCKVCPGSSDFYLQNAFSFASLLTELSRYSNQTAAAEITSLIDRLNTSFENLQPN